MITRAISVKVIARCDHPLAGDRTCCHVGDARAIGYDHCPGNDNQCWHSYPLRRLHRHSHTWQPADAKRVDIDGREIDMETGEIGVTPISQQT